MAEIGRGELQGELIKALDIHPQSEINMADGEKFWDDVFSKEIPDAENNDVESGDNIENKHKSVENDTDSIKDFWQKVFSEPIEDEESLVGSDVTDTQEGLTPEEKDLIKQETGWSDEIVNAIRSMDEYRIYKEAGLVEGEVNGRKCLMKTDIDWEQKDAFGMTNRERVAEGYAPLDKDGRPIQLHHIGQHADSPLAELTFSEHRAGGNDKILHDKNKETEVHGEGNHWDNERKDYWKNRLTNGGGGNE